MEHMGVRRIHINMVALLLLVLTTNVQSEVGDGALTVLTKSTETVRVAPNTLLLVDGPDSISELAGVSLAHGGFKKNVDDAINGGFGEEPIYGVFQVENKSDEVDWFLRFGYPLLDDLKVYRIDEATLNVEALIYESGDRRPFEEREVGLSAFVTRLSLPPGERTTFAFRIQTEGARYSDIELFRSESLAAESSTNSFRVGLYFGGIIILALYNCLLFAYFRSRQYLSFFSMVMSMAGFFFAEQGYALQYLFPDSPNLATRFFLVSLSTIPLTGFWLLAVFFFRALAIRQRRLIVSLIGLSGFVVLLSFGLRYAVSARIGLFMVGLFLLVANIVSLQALRAGFTPARNFFLALVFLTAGGILESLRVLGVVPINDLIRFGPALGIGAFMLFMSLALTVRIQTIQRRNRALVSSFQKFAPTALVKALHKNTEVVSLGGSRREVSVLFSDIKGYSSVVEFSEPEDVVNLMTEYFENMQQSVERHGGYILEFAGDGILAVFGAPDVLSNHSQAATNCALSMLKLVESLNQKYVATGQSKHFTNAGVEKLEIRIGIHSGSVIAGTLGSRQTLKYGVIGDAVNVAARLEAMNKETDSHLLISSDTFLRVDRETQNRFDGLGEKSVKGRTEPVAVFKLVCGAHFETEASFDLRSINDFELKEESLV